MVDIMDNPGARRMVDDRVKKVVKAFVYTKAKAERKV